MKLQDYFPILSERDQSLPFYVTTIGTTPHQPKIYRPDGMKDYQILYCLQGEGMVFVQGEEMKISEGMGFYLPPNTMHSYYPIASPWQTRWITFNGKVVEQIMDFGLGVFKITQIEHLENLFIDLITLPRDEWWAENSSVSLYKLLLGMKNCIATDTASSILDLRLQLKKVTDYLNHHFHEPVELMELAQLIDVSPSHLCRLFKGAYNVRPFEYLTSLRLQKAKELMFLYPERSIAQISAMVGYNSPSYFSLLFKRQEKRTAGDFRAQP